MKFPHVILSIRIVILNVTKWSEESLDSSSAVTEFCYLRITSQVQGDYHLDSICTVWVAIG
jgi:hypothetical protein